MHHPSQELDMLLPRNHPAMNRLQRQGADLASVLGPAEARVVGAAVLLATA